MIIGLILLVDQHVFEVPYGLSSREPSDFICGWLDGPELSGGQFATCSYWYWQKKKKKKKKKKFIVHRKKQYK